MGMIQSDVYVGRLDLGLPILSLMHASWAAMDRAVHTGLTGFNYITDPLRLSADRQIARRR